MRATEVWKTIYMDIYARYMLMKLTKRKIQIPTTFITIQMLNVSVFGKNFWFFKMKRTSD